MRGAAEAPPDFISLAIGYLSTALPQICIIVYILYVQKENLADFGIGKPKGSTWGWAGAAFGLALFIMLAVMVIYTLLPEGTGEDLLRPQQVGVNSIAQLPAAFLFCLAVGYREELFFRSFLLTRLTQLGVRPAWAVLGTSLIFGMAHFGQGVIGVLTTFGIGLVFGLVFNAKKDVHAVAIAHAFYNFTLLAISVVGRNLAG